MTVTRRVFMAALAAAAAQPAFSRRAHAEGEPFSHEQVIALAEALSKKRYKARPMVPEAWQTLTYDQYRAMQFDTKKAMWRESPSSYEVDFFAPGLYFPRSVQVFEVMNGMALPVPFEMDKFKIYDHVALPDLPVDETLGYSGLRLRTFLDVPGKKTEYAVFQGASYFRAIGVGQTYGLSARGLALNTGDPEGEEFPDFTHFWIERPDAEQRDVVVHALLDSPSVSGAYRFDISPGEAAVIDIQATLFPREDLEHVGIAPLTSMFLFDEKDRSRFDDFRPAVHDSDGLLMKNGVGETIWRPLSNPRELQVSSFVDENPKGFGLMQRARDLDDFADFEALYHNRPSLWVEPMGDWGAGVVRLVEIPADREIYDNIVAYWRPTEPLAAGSRTDLSYRLTWGRKAPGEGGLPRVANTLMGRDFDGKQLAVIEFEPHPMHEGDLEDIDIHVSSPHIELNPPILQRNPVTGGLRLAFSYEPGDRTAAEMRAQLRRNGENISEIWLYRWTS
ncbi:glucan biosynthesis protein [Chachezhania antarctica]|uniref:glucan biosynthesis protein n=1 Tax=Chachezhania antarctica TaxID=2340860 RepID=UPI000EB22454|nr:glucan biosynthesis protein G [Chachezhania antarctica]